ncbi:MAG: alanine racemase [Planctomycetota bacterium]|jgi:alanine racemase
MLKPVNPYRVWADIDLDAVTHNLQLIREQAGAGIGVILVVKADAYGHGAIAISHHAVRCGVEALGVGTCSEALELRQSGITVPILVLGTIVDEEVAIALGHNIELGLHSTDRQQMLQRVARRIGVRARVHLNIDTGMGRLGVLPQRAMELLRRVHSSSHLELAGVMTHIAATEGAQAPETTAQIGEFEGVLAEARAEGLLNCSVHAANSACLFTGMRPIYDLVRPGISAYGVLPSTIPGSERLRPALALRSQVVFIKDVPEGSTIGYGNSWRAARTTRIATLPLGYDDGVPWRLSNCGTVLLRGQFAPIVGRVSMDYTTIDVTDISDAAVGDVVTLIGKDGDQSLIVDEIAERAQTIPYEITCSVGKRVTRIYHGGRVMAPISDRELQRGQNC